MVEEEEEEKVICPTCKLYSLKSRVYVIDWQKFLQKIVVVGYYNEDGDYVKSNVFLPISKTFCCTFGHFWMQTS